MRSSPAEILPRVQTRAGAYRLRVSDAIGRCGLPGEANRVALQNERIYLSARYGTDDQEWFRPGCNLIWQRRIGRFVG